METTAGVTQVMARAKAAAAIFSQLNVQRIARQRINERLQAFDLALFFDDTGRRGG